MTAQATAFGMPPVAAAAGPELVPSQAAFSLDAGPMSRVQILVVVLAVLLASLDGYDALAMAFVGPIIKVQWGLGKATLGLLLSGALAGMALSSLFLSFLADIRGRKPVMLFNLVLMTAGALLSAFCHTAPELLACRILTGLGVGSMVALTTSIAAEFSNKRIRPVAVAVSTIGFSVGAAIGGGVAALFLHAYGWKAIFVIGAATAAILIPVVAFLCPESPAFIIAKRPANALETLNRTLARMGRPPLASLPQRDSRPQRSSYRALFGPGLTAITLRFAAVFTLVTTAAYYVLSWLPQLVADAGYSASTAGMVSAVSSFVGIFAALILGTLATVVGPARVAAVAMIGFGLGVASLGLVPPHLTALMVAACASGFFLGGTTAVFYATLAATFPPLARVSGIGFVSGTGRILSAGGPALAGWMFAVGLTRSEVSLVFAAGSIVAGVLLLTGMPRRVPA